MSGVGTKRVLKLLIDTNVWLDYFLARTNATRPIVEFLSRAAEAEDIVIATLAEAIAGADETAWACVRLIRQKSIIASVGADEVFDSFVFKYHHNDFEDDLMLGVANRIDADYVVTEDKNLIKHTNGVCINVQQALKLVEGSNVPSARPV